MPFVVAVTRHRQATVVPSLAHWITPTQGITDIASLVGVVPIDIDGGLLHLRQPLLMIAGLRDLAPG
ncbi:hypothetical protein D3C81_2047700 [compost metagenome]